MLAFTVFPLGYSLYLAFFKIESKVEVTREKVPVLDEQGEPVLLSSGKPRTENVVHKNQVTTSEFVGAFNFQRLLDDPQVATAIRVTAVFVLIAVPAELALGFLLALLFNQQLFARAGAAHHHDPADLRHAARGRLSVLHDLLRGGRAARLPRHPVPVRTRRWAMFSIILVDVWQWTPFCFLVFLAALQGVPDELYEAARIDGASNVDMLTRVLLPLLQPTILIVLLLRLAEALKLFDVPFALTGGGPGIATQSYSFLAFRVGLRYFDLGYASAMAYVLLIVVMIIMTLFFRRLRETYG